MELDTSEPSITLENGDKFVGDVLIGADGVHVCPGTSLALSNQELAFKNWTILTPCCSPGQDLTSLLVFNPTHPGEVASAGSAPLMI